MAEERPLCLVAALPGRVVLPLLGSRENLLLGVARSHRWRRCPPARAGLAPVLPLKATLPRAALHPFPEGNYEWVPASLVRKNRLWALEEMKETEVRKKCLHFTTKLLIPHTRFIEPCSL